MENTFPWLFLGWGRAVFRIVLLLLCVSQIFANAPMRTRRVGPSLYVAPSGDDTRGALTPETAVRTIQRAVDIALYDIDSAGQPPQIWLANGDYAPFQVVADGVGANQVAVHGNPKSPRLVTITGRAAGPIVYAKDKGIVTIDGVILQGAVPGAWGLLAEQLAVIDFRDLVFGDMPGGYHISAVHAGYVNCIGDYSITGGAISHLNAQCAGHISPGGNYSVRIVGAPAFEWFWMADSLAIIDVGVAPVMYKGSISGRSYVVQHNAVIIRGETVIPGQRGTTRTGGDVVPEVVEDRRLRFPRELIIAICAALGGVVLGLRIRRNVSSK